MPDGRAVALKYVRSGAVLTDLLTILPTVLQVVLRDSAIHQKVMACCETGIHTFGVLPCRAVSLLQTHSSPAMTWLQFKGWLLR